MKSKLRKIRDVINNNTWLLNIFCSDKRKFMQICVCIDVLGDTQEAIDSYTNLPDFSRLTGGYLFLYGLLQVLFIQQDAISNLINALLDKRIEWSKDYPIIFNIRELRNDVAGHPTNRNQRKSFHFISMHSICNESFDVASYDEQNNFDLVIKKNNIYEIIKVQRKIIISLLSEILKELEIKLITHKMKFEGDKMVDKMPQEYDLTKIGEAIDIGYLVVEMNIKILKESIEKIKLALDQRYGNIDDYTVLKDFDYILNRFDEWNKTSQLQKNPDAKIFWYALRAKYKELRETLQEVDNDFR